MGFGIENLDRMICRLRVARCGVQGAGFRVRGYGHRAERIGHGVLSRTI